MAPSWAAPAPPRPAAPAAEEDCLEEEEGPELGSPLPQPGLAGTPRQGARRGGRGRPSFPRALDSPGGPARQPRAGSRAPDPRWGKPPAARQRPLEPPRVPEHRPAPSSPTPRAGPPRLGWSVTRPRAATLLTPLPPVPEVQQPRAACPQQPRQACQEPPGQVERSTWTGKAEHLDGQNGVTQTGTGWQRVGASYRWARGPPGPPERAVLPSPRGSSTHCRLEEWPWPCLRPCGPGAPAQLDRGSQRPVHLGPEPLTVPEGHRGETRVPCTSPALSQRRAHLKGTGTAAPPAPPLPEPRPVRDPRRGSHHTWLLRIRKT
nr:proline-rich protein HaeIII subfamily 1-like [Dasypus novemcinctus]